MKNQNGFTFVEILVALGIMSVLAVAMMSVLTVSSNQTSRMMTNTTESKMVSDLVEQISANPDMYQKYYALTDSSLSAALPANNLPLAWSADFLGDAKDCPDCTGRVGYVLTPLQTMPGLYLVTIRYTNPSVFDGSKDFKILVGTR